MRTTVQKGTTPRTRITADGDTRTTVARWDEYSEAWITTEYMRPLAGGYVRVNDGRQYPQVCEGLYGTGDTLFCDAATPLVRIIRREYRRAVRAERARLVG